MSTPQLVLVWTGTMAALFSMGLFVNFEGREPGEVDVTRMVVTFTASLFWGVFGLLSRDVIVATTNTEPIRVASQPVLPVSYLGLALAFCLFSYAVLSLFKGLFASTEGAPDASRFLR